MMLRNLSALTRVNALENSRIRPLFVAPLLGEFFSSSFSVLSSRQQQQQGRSSFQKIDDFEDSSETLSSYDNFASSRKQFNRFDDEGPRRFERSGFGGGAPRGSSRGGRGRGGFSSRRFDDNDEDEAPRFNRFDSRGSGSRGGRGRGGRGGFGSGRQRFDDQDGGRGGYGGGGRGGRQSGPRRSSFRDYEDEEEEVKTEKSDKMIELPDLELTHTTHDGKFSSAGFAPMLQAALKSQFHNFEKMTEIQSNTIPVILNNDIDIIAKASTGSGKTLAFLLPCIDFLVKRAQETKQAPRTRTAGALILAPTRELALQIGEVARRILSAPSLQSLNLRMVTTIGGESLMKDERELGRGADLIVATPGRCLDHLNTGIIQINPDTFRYFVLDEADMLIQTGFERELKQIAKLLPANHRTMLFSATMTGKVDDLALVSLRKDRLVSIGVHEEDSKRNVDTLEQHYLEVPADKKLASLMALLDQHRDDKIIVFVQLKSAVKFYSKMLELHGFSNCALHGDMSQKSRTKTFFDFAQQKGGILIATNVAARGLDFPDIDLVIQCEMPEHIPQYFHRVGRTARAGKDGKAVLLMSPIEVKSCLQLLKNELKEHPKDKEDHITPFEAPAEDLVNSYQQKIDKDTSRDPELMELAMIVARQSAKSADMHGPKVGLAKGSFDIRAAYRSVGVTGAVSQPRHSDYEESSNNYQGSNSRGNRSFSGARQDFGQRRQQGYAGRSFERHQNYERSYERSENRSPRRSSDYSSRQIHFEKSEY